MSVIDREDFYQADMATAPLRFMHLYDDLLSSGKLADPKLKVMTLGLGCMFARFEGKSGEHATFPQRCELRALLENNTQTLDCFDYSPRLVREASKHLGYDKSVLEHFFETMVPDAPELSESVKKLVQHLSDRLDLEKRETLPVTQYILWNPQDPDDSPPEASNRYDVIVATCSALFHRYIEPAQVFPTWLRILKMLNDRGVLYVDACSFRVIRRDHNLRSQLETAIGAPIAFRKIPPIVSINVELAPDLPAEMIQRLNVTKYPILYRVMGKDGKAFEIAASSYALYAIEKQV